MRSEFFSKNFLNRLSHDDDQAIIQISVEYSNMLNKLGNDINYDEDFSEAYAIFRAFTEVRNITLSIPNYKPTEINRQLLGNFFDTKRKNAKKRLARKSCFDNFQTKEENYRVFFSNEPVYRFREDEYKRVTNLLDEIDSYIHKTDVIQHARKRKLHRRLAAVKSELNQECADIDRFWGFVAEAEIVSKKYGQGVDSFNKLVQELKLIVADIISAEEGIKSMQFVGGLSIY
jgi:hypothetical protein